MRHINPELIEKFESQEYIPVILIDIIIEEDENRSLRFTSWSDIVKYEDNIYRPRGMNVGTVSYGLSTIVSSFTLRLDDVDRAVYATIGGKGPTEWPMVVTLVVLDDVGQPITDANVVLFNGYVTEWSYQPGSVSFKVSSILRKWTKVTTRLFSPSCTVKVFKSPQCGYVGSENVCDRTYNQCDMYNNTLNFRGFRYLPEMRNRKIEFPVDY